MPSIGPSGLAFYNGDRFLQWKGNLFVGSVSPRRDAAHRAVLSAWSSTDKLEELRRETLLDRAASAHPRCAARPGRAALRADGRGRRRAAENRARDLRGDVYFDGAVSRR